MRGKVLTDQPDSFVWWNSEEFPVQLKAAKPTPVAQAAEGAAGPLLRRGTGGQHAPAVTVRGTVCTRGRRCHMTRRAREAQREPDSLVWRGNILSLQTDSEFRFECP